MIQPDNQFNENKAMNDRINRYSDPRKPIFIADRAYEPYNQFAQVQEQNKNDLIRAKNRHSNGILSGLSLPDEEEFDSDIE